MSLISPSAPVTHWQIGMTNGALFGVPIPERYEVVGETLQRAVEAALAEADQNGMNQRGKEVTPWLLKRIGELTNGTSLASSQWSFALVFYCDLTAP
jgi:pseudouridylate synthase / pseudouridine kinase